MQVIRRDCLHYLRAQMFRIAKSSITSISGGTIMNRTFCARIWPLQPFARGLCERVDKEQPPWRALGLVALVGCGIGAYYNIRNYEEKERSAASVVVGRSVGRPSLGGSFQLLDHNKKVVRDTDFNGKWRFMYFGFTYCPDICPNELLRMVEVLKILDNTSPSHGLVVPLFVTIDPARDGPDQLKSYLSDWHPRLQGLTGTQEQIDDVCKKFRVYCSKSQLGPNPMDYLIDHSVMFYLVDPDGRFVDYFAKNMTPSEIAARISSYATDYAASKRA